jgi:hypothetical protein
MAALGCRRKEITQLTRAAMFVATRMVRTDLPIPLAPDLEQHVRPALPPLAPTYLCLCGYAAGLFTVGGGQRLGRHNRRGTREIDIPERRELFFDCQRRFPAAPHVLTAGNSCVWKAYNSPCPYLNVARALALRRALSDSVARRSNSSCWQKMACCDENWPLAG